MSVNDDQVGGDHYKRQPIQHWDFAAANEFDYFQGQITKYVSRWKMKNGIQDLEKALHFLQKYLEVVRAGGFSGGEPSGLELRSPRELSKEELKACVDVPPQRVNIPEPQEFYQ